MNIATNNNPWNAIRAVLVVAVSVVVITGLFRLTEAVPPAEPTALPASSSQSLEKLYGALASPGYDSSALTGDRNGSALQVAKCIIRKMTGGTPCP
jgi:hypothetical protein